MKIRYFTNLDIARPRQQPYAAWSVTLTLLVDTDDGRWQACSRITLSEFDLLDDKHCDGQIKERRGAEAAYKMWKLVRDEKPEVFAYGVEQGWARAPNDCAACRGRGWNEVDRVNEFRRALQYGMWNNITGEDYRSPCIERVRETCPKCEGRRWA